MSFERMHEAGGDKPAARWAVRMPRAGRTAVATLAWLALAGCAGGRMPMLDPAGSVGEAEARLFYLSVGVMLMIIVPVILITLWFAWRYRASSSKDAYDPKFSSSSIIGRITLFVPLLTIAFLGSINWVYTHRLDPYRPMPGKGAPYEIQAISLDYKWLFIYPEEGVATINELVAPTGRPITLRMTSDPMMTAIFIPGLISQIYTMPGMETRANFQADTPVVRQGANAMYSGPGFEYQRFKARLVSPEDFRRWVAALKQGQGGEKQVAVLDWAGFQALLSPSTDNPVTHYASVEAGLFSRAVRKYMPHYRMKPLPNRSEFDRGTPPTPAGAGAHEHAAMAAIQTTRQER